MKNIFRALRAAFIEGAAVYRRTRHFQKRRVTIPPTF